MTSDPQKEKKTPKYSAERVIGSGSFGIVYQAICTTTKETLAIKKVLEDRRYKNRELSIMKSVNHPNIVALKDCFYSRHSKKKNDIYLNLVMEYIPETLYKTIREHARAKQTIPFFSTKLYAYQIFRAVSYLHTKGICHRDIKPQNVLLDPSTHIVKLCDFGSAKVLVEGEPNVAYICSRYYRAPELIFESSHYKTTIDVWSLGCVIAELYLGTPLFQGQSGVDQLVEIIKILGAPSKEEIIAMNKNYTQYRFPAVKPLPWSAVFTNCTWNNQPVPEDGIELISKTLTFTPSARIDAFSALAHPFFDELRVEGCTLSHNKELPPLFNFSDEEETLAKKLGVYEKVVKRTDAQSGMKYDTGFSQIDDPSYMEGNVDNEPDVPGQM